MDAGLGRLHRVVLVMHRRGRAGQIVDLVDLDVERERHVVPDELEARMAIRCIMCCFVPVNRLSTHSPHPVAVLQQSVDEMRAQKAGPPVTMTRLVSLYKRPIGALSCWS